MCAGWVHPGGDRLEEEALDAMDEATFQAWLRRYLTAASAAN